MTTFLTFINAIGRSWQRQSHVMFLSSSGIPLIKTALLGLLFYCPGQVVAEESFCAQVSIEIKQQLTLERQAFDAHMRINNGLTGFVVENVKVDVKVSDEKGIPVLASSDPNNTKAAFFIKVDSLTGIDNVNGTGAVPASSSADIHWLLIPAPGSAGKISTGKLYFVGATLTYKLNGEEKVTEITPDFIYVKPLPLLSLDYFLPKEVYADDAFTKKIEPPVPFTLGVRVTNNGDNTATDLKIDSGQPKIVENKLGLLINFKINSSFVDDSPVAPSLLLNFGDIPAKSAKMGRWQMETTLSGEFTGFTAHFSHADELGGELTSLLDSSNSHQYELVHDVLVDLPGRDAVRDFLAKDIDALRVYESNGVDTLVTNQSAKSQLTPVSQQGKQSSYTLNMPVTDGFVYVQLSDPNSGSKDIIRVLRSDGKVLNPANYWLSKTRRVDNSWNYFINIFDQNSGGQYSLVMDAFPVVPHPPVLQFIPDRAVAEGKSVGFVIEASDEDGTIPALNASQLPSGATFTDRGNGEGDFKWTPQFNQAGTYPIKYIASDGALSTQRTANITVTDAQVIIIDKDITLQQGFNLITYPVQTDKPKNTCLTLLNNIGNKSVVTSINRYNSQIQQNQVCDHNSSNDFVIGAGDALMIQMRQLKTITLSGQKTCPSWEINPGANFVGHPSPPKDYSCFDLMTSINASVTTIQSFNKTTGRFETCAWDKQTQQAVGTDFPIHDTEGLIVNATQQQLISLPGCE